MWGVCSWRLGGEEGGGWGILEMKLEEAAVSEDEGPWTPC